jgi:hypothetical protein
MEKKCCANCDWHRYYHNESYLKCDLKLEYNSHNYCCSDWTKQKSK